MTNERRFYVYMAWHKSTNEPIYVGKGCGNRLSCHNRDAETGLHYNKFMVEYVKQHGRMKFEIVRNNLTNQEAIQTEIDLIYYFGRKDLGFGTLFNRTDGGEGGTGPKTEDHKAKIGKALKGRVRSASHSAAISKGNKGKPKPSLSAIATARFKGVPKTKEHNAKNSAAQKGRPKTAEHKLKLRLGRLNYLARKKKEMLTC